MTIRKHKWLICSICKQPFFGDVKSSNCQREGCLEILRLRRLKYARDYNKKHKNRDRAYHKDRNKTWRPIKIYTKRICLRCRKPFKSEGAHNRICDTCRGINERIGNVEIYSMSKLQR